MKENKKVYLGGTILGLAKEKYTSLDDIILKLYNKGYTVRSPAEIENPESKNFILLKDESLKILNECEYIYFIEGHEISRATIYEREYAKDRGIKLLEL